MNKILFIFFTIFSVFAYGQKDSSFCKHYISINLTELLVVDPKITYEYKINSKYSIKTELGYKFQMITYSPFSGYYSPFDGTYNLFQIHPYSYNNFSLSAGYDYYFMSKKAQNQYYFSGMFMYKYDFCKNLVLVGGEDGEYYYNLFNGSQNFYEIKLLVGQRIMSMKNRNSPSSFLEYYIGFGISEKCGKSSVNGHALGHDAMPTASQINFDSTTKIINSDNLTPSFYLGLKCGIAWKRKN